MTAAKLRARRLKLLRELAADDAAMVAAREGEPLGLAELGRRLLDSGDAQRARDELARVEAKIAKLEAAS